MLVRSLLAGIILLGGALGCGPGRGGGRRRSPRKLTPLVFKQHIPNLPEFTMAAAGSPEGPLSRNDPKFKQLVPNYNADIIFRDEEGSGSDRLMTKRCLEKLNMLSISVMNQWPGLRLRVTESYDEEFHHSTTSLHYEGRAVDITTSDRDRSKYGLLARLAIEAGFDYVSYASRSHIHASVKSESAYASRSGGCFSADSVVQTPQGPRNMSELSIGDEVLVVNGDIVQFSPIIMFLDRDPSENRLYVKIKTHSSEILMTPSHLLFIANDPEENTSAALKFKQGLHHVTFAEEVKPGDFVYVRSNSSEELVLEQVLEVTKTIEQGVYAPLTHVGNLLVNNVVASCYAILKQQTLAHLGFVPYRVMHNFFNAATHFLQKIDVVPLRVSNSSYRTRQQSTGIHWYADLLYRVFSSSLPEELLYPVAFD